MVDLHRIWPRFRPACHTGCSWEELDGKATAHDDSDPCRLLNNEANFLIAKLQFLLGSAAGHLPLKDGLLFS